ncbi:MAG: DUF4197 domain-containing protein [Rubrivivax sp.]|nr:DUF4197 domain-containing protein [Rubrivivax sp.]MBK8528863.1 DUF4197 domain-containing protein [Rubrivivax sp.]
MQKRQFTLAICAAGSWGFSPVARAALGMDDAAAGVRAALERGAQSAIQLLGRNDGFLGNPKVRIALPGVLDDAAKLMSKMGQKRRVDELITAMNRAAEAAVPAARTLLVDTVRKLSVEDAIGIVRGGSTSVTDFFARKTREPLGVQFLPIVTRATEKVKLADRYNDFASRASRLGLLRGDNANLQTYVTGKTLDGLYLMIGEEEQRIRADPVKSGSAILRKVFGG